jgi:hypothetical protein
LPQYGTGAGRPSGSRAEDQQTIDWRQFQLDDAAARGQEREQEQIERQLLEEMGQEYVNLYQAESRLGLTAERALAFGQPTEAPPQRTALEAIGRVLDLPKSFIVGTVSGLAGWDRQADEDIVTDAGIIIPGRRSEDIATGRNNFAVAMDRALNVLFHGESYGFGDFGVLRYESEETRRAERVALGTAAFILDTAFDPLTYASFGSSIFGRAIASQGVKRATQKVAQEALEGSSDAFLRGQVSALPKGLLARRAAEIVGEDAGRLITRSADELTDIISGNPELFGRLAGDAWSTGNAAAYAAMGRTGLYDRMVATIGRENADKYFRMLPEDIQGGLRWRVPFVRTVSEETGLRMPTVVRFPFSHPGYGFDAIGMGAVTRRVNQFRLDRRTGLFKPVEKIQGRYGDGWTGVLQAAKRGDAEAVAAYTEWFGSMVLDTELKKVFATFDKIADSGVRRAAQKLRTFAGNQEEVADLAGDLYFKRGRPDGTINADTPDKMLAQDIANEMFNVTDRLHDLFVEIYGADAAAKMQDYATRMMTKEGLEEIAQRYGYMFARPTRVVDSAAGRKYSSFPKKMDVDKDGKLVVLEWFTPGEIASEFGRELFIDDPILAVGAYTHMMRREIGRDWTLRYMQDNGMLMPLAEDVITKPTMTRIMNETKGRLSRVRRARKALEAGDNADEISGALLEAERLAREAAQRFARTREVEPNVWRSEDDLVQLSRDRAGTWSATVDGEPVAPQIGRATPERFDVPFDTGPEPDWDKLRAIGGRGYRQQIPGTTETDETIRAAGGIPVGEPVPVAPLPKQGVPSERLRPYLESGQDSDLELIHQTLRREVSGARRVSRARQQQAERDLETLESLHPSLRAREYPDFVPPPAAPAEPPAPAMVREATDLGTLKPVKSGEARLTFKDGTEASIVRRLTDPNDPGSPRAWFAEYQGRDLGSYSSRSKAVDAVRQSVSGRRRVDIPEVDVQVSRATVEVIDDIRGDEFSEMTLTLAVERHRALLQRYAAGALDVTDEAHLYVDIKAIEQAALESRNPQMMRSLYDELVESYQILGEFDGIYPPLLSEVRASNSANLPIRGGGALTDGQAAGASRVRDAWKKRDTNLNSLVRAVDDLADDNPQYAVEVLEELFNAARSEDARSLALTLSYRTELRALSSRVRPLSQPVYGGAAVDDALDPGAARRARAERRPAREDVDPDLDFDEVIPAAADGQWEDGLFYADGVSGREVRIAPEIAEPSPRAIDVDPVSSISGGPYESGNYTAYALGRNYTARPETDGSFTILRRKNIKAKDVEVGRIDSIDEFDNFVISDARAFAAEQGLDDPFRRVFLEPYTVDGEEQFLGAYGNITYRIERSADTYFASSSQDAKPYVSHGTFRNLNEAVDAIAFSVRTDPPRLSEVPAAGLFDVPEAAVARAATPAAQAAPTPEDALRGAIRELNEIDQTVSSELDALVRGEGSLSLDQVEMLEDQLIDRIAASARVLASEDADAARRIVAENIEDATMRAAVSDQIEQAATLAAQPPVGGGGTALRGFNSKWEAEYAANRVADKIRAPQARAVRDEVFETNRQEIIAKLNEDETWLSALLDPKNLQQFPEEDLATYIDRVTGLVNAVDPTIRPTQDIIDKTRYSQALADAGFRALNRDGLNNRVTNIIVEEGLFGTDQTAAILRRHFSLQNDMDGAETFYATVWRPYYTSMKAWMTMGRGYGYTSRNMIGSMYNAWLADVQLRHFKESGAMIAARRGAKVKADEEIISRRVLEGENTAEIWDDIFYREFENALTSKSGVFGGYSKKRANYIIRAYRAFTDNDFGGRAAGGRTRGEILDSSKYDPTFYGPVPGYESARLYPGKTQAELTPGQRIMEKSVNNAWMRHVTRVNEGMEDYLRFATFMKGTDIYGLDDGGLAAGLYVRGTQFDYADLSDFERKVMKNIVPFYTWTRYNVPLQIRSVWMEPGKVNRLLRFHEEVLKAWTGEDREQEGTLPEWLRRRGGWMTTMTTPLSDPETALGRFFGFKEDPIAAFIESPLSDLGMLFNATINPLQLMNMDEVVNNLNPLLGKTAYEAITGRSYTSGRELSPERDEPPRWAYAVPGLVRQSPEGEQVYDERWAQTLRNLVPPFAQLERLGAPVLGDQRMRRRFPTTVAAQLAAVPLYTVDPNQQAFAMNQEAERLNEQLRQTVPGYRDERRDFATRLIERGFTADDLRRLGLERPDIDINNFNVDELDRILRQQRQDEQLERFMETMTERQQNAFIARRGYRGRTGREAIELWGQRGTVDPLDGLYEPRVADAFEAWFETLDDWQQTRAVFQYGFGPYRGRQAVQNWREQGGYPNVPTNVAPSEISDDLLRRN